jgi:hypothetical protein
VTAKEALARSGTRWRIQRESGVDPRTVRRVLRGDGPRNQAWARVAEACDAIGVELEPAPPAPCPVCAAKDAQITVLLAQLDELLRPARMAEARAERTRDYDPNPPKDPFVRPMEFDDSGICHQSVHVERPGARAAFAVKVPARTRIVKLQDGVTGAEITLEPEEAAG